jgi:hypothetical protein
MSALADLSQERGFSKTIQNNYQERKRPMHTRIVIAIVVCFLVPALALQTPAFGAKKSTPNSSFLSEEFLRGSMQGQSGIAINQNGDGNEYLVIGAPYAQHNGATGALLFYSTSQGKSSRRPSFILEGEGNLGWSLVSLGKMNGEGKNYFAAGGFSGTGSKASLSGTVTIYKMSLNPEKVAVLEGEDALDKFGYALAAGDVNGDGAPDLIVGAPFNSPSPALYQRGTVYVYFGPSYDPSQALKISATAAAGGIGFSLATGDINGDGIDDLLMQASGKVICYYGSRESFAPSPASPDAVFSSADAGFGRGIKVLWDLDKDGFQDIAVGAEQATINGVIDSGRLFILKGGPGPRSVNADADTSDRLAKIDGEPHCGRFGSAIQLVGDIDSDGTPDLAVSAVHADGARWPMTGKILLFSGVTLMDGIDLSLARSIPGEARDMHLGSFLALVDSGRQLAAGAPTEDANTGKVRLFYLR